MSSSPKQPEAQQEADAAAHYLRDLLVRFLVDASASEPRVMQASGTLEQVVQAALTRHDAHLKEQLARIERELAAVRQQLQQSAGSGGQDLALTLQHVRGEVALLGEQVQKLSRSITGPNGRQNAGQHAGPNADTATVAGPGAGRASGWWRTALIAGVIVLAGALLYMTYRLTSSAGQRPPALPDSHSQLQSQPQSDITAQSSRSRRRGSVSALPQSAVSSAAEPVAASRSSLARLAWEHVWDQAVTQPFNCPGDPGATTLLQCACPEVHPAPPAGYPYEGVGERCPPGPAWNGRLAVAALQAVLKLEEPELATNIDGLPQHLYPALDQLTARCALRLGPEGLASPDGPDPGTASVRVLSFLRNNPGCLSER